MNRVVFRVLLGNVKHRALPCFNVLQHVSITISISQHVSICIGVFHFVAVRSNVKHGALPCFNYCSMFQ